MNDAVLPPALMGHQEENGDSKEDDFVDPWNVTSKSATGVDYDKLIGKLTISIGNFC